MILAVDIGNTNIVIGGIDAGAITFEARMATDRVKTSDQYTAELYNILLLFHVDIAKIEGSIIASVVPPVLNSFKTAIRKLTGEYPLIVGPGIKTGLNIKTDFPAQTGSDLVAGSVAALHRYPLPAAIVDMGTATTIFVLDKSGAFIGGSICPGVKISMDALTSRTTLLPGISLDTPKRAIGKNTIDCMQSGIMFGAAAMIDGIVDRMEEELGEPIHLIITGGIGKFVHPLMKHPASYDKDILLQGLWDIWSLNQK